MSKRPLVDLAALTSESAAPMQEAVQRAAPRLMQPPAPAPTPPPAAVTPDPAPVATKAAKPGGTPTANLQALAFKVPPAFRKRFRQRAANADLKLNELLFEAMDAWEAAHGLKK